MDSFLEIKSLSAEEQKKILDKIQKKIEEKKKTGILSEHEIRDIEEMKLQPLPDILDIQSVFESITFDD